MTMVSGVDAASKPAFTSTWSRVDDGLWVCSTNGEFVGTVESTDGAFRAIDWCGQLIARYDSLAEAQARVERPFIDGIPYLDRADSVRDRTLALRNAALVAGGLCTAFAIVALMLGA